MTNQEAYERAERRAASKFTFYVHLAVYVVVCTALFALNMVASTGYLWAVWPLMGWGIGVLLHAVRVFVSGGQPVPERMIETEMSRDV